MRTKHALRFLSLLFTAVLLSSALFAQTPAAQTRGNSAQRSQEDFTPAEREMLAEASRLNKEGLKLLEQRKYDASLALVQRALEPRLKVLGPEDH
jgi:hypothetical protein